MIDKIYEDDQNYIVFTSDLSIEETKQFLNMHNISFKQGIEKYFGVEKITFIVNEDKAFDIIPLIGKQKSVLILSEVKDNGNRDATLIYKDLLIPDQFLGKFREVTKEEAETANGYTQCNDNYFVSGGK